MTVSTSWVDGSTFFAADLNDLTKLVYTASTSTAFYPYSTEVYSQTTHTHTGTYYPYSTDTYSVSTHVHSTYAPITGSTVYISGTTTDLGVMFGDLDGGRANDIFGGISPISGGTSA